MRRLCRSIVNLAFLQLVFFGCASREFEDGTSIIQSDPQIPRTIENQENLDGRETDIFLLRQSGSLIHESENKQPLYVKRLLRSIADMAEDAERLRVDRAAGRAAPTFLRPVAGYSSPIGQEVYMRDEILPGFNERDPALTSQKLTDWKNLWFLVTPFAGQLGFYQTARHIKEYLLVHETVREKGALANSELTEGIVFAALDQMGYWAWPDEGTSELSQGERSLERNRDLVLLELMKKMSPSGQKDQSAIKSYVRALANDQNPTLLWVRTHKVVRPSENSDWDLALGEFSLLTYTFASVSEVKTDSFLISLISYDFLHGVHRWTRERTRKALDAWCGVSKFISFVHEENCNKLVQVQDALGNPSLALLAKRGLATEFRARGYSPIMLMQERIRFDDLNGEALLETERRLAVPPN